jgi:hypothetical protein
MVPTVPVEGTPDRRGMIDAEPFLRRSAAHDGNVPAERAALIRHLRTSMVQYLGLESCKLTVKKQSRKS